MVVNSSPWALADHHVVQGHPTTPAASPSSAAGPPVEARGPPACDRSSYPAVGSRTGWLIAPIYIGELSRYPRLAVRTSISPAALMPLGGERTVGVGQDRSSIEPSRLTE